MLHNFVAQQATGGIPVWTEQEGTLKLDRWLSPRKAITTRWTLYIDRWHIVCTRQPDGID